MTVAPYRVYFLADERHCMVEHCMRLEEYGHVRLLLMLKGKPCSIQCRYICMRKGPSVSGNPDMDNLTLVRGFGRDEPMLEVSLSVFLYTYTGELSLGGELGR